MSDRLFGGTLETGFLCVTSASKRKNVIETRSGSLLVLGSQEAKIIGNQGSIR